MNAETADDLARTMERCVDHMNAHVTLTLDMSDIPTLANIAKHLRAYSASCAEVEIMREALKPFADKAAHCETDDAKYAYHYRVFQRMSWDRIPDDYSVTIKLGDLRRAALASAPVQED